MTKEKLSQDTVTLHRFVQLYCDQKHKDTIKTAESLMISFNNEKLCELPYCLCEECKNTFLYAYARLQACPHVIKPSCRNCPSPCYERSMWKSVATIMSYSGMRLGLTRMRKFFFK